MTTGPITVAAVITSPIPLSGIPTLPRLTDFVSLADGSVVLLIGQIDGRQNGLWVVHTGVWTRHSSFPSGSTLTPIAVSVSTAGTYWPATAWQPLPSSSPIVVDTNPQWWLRH